MGESLLLYGKPIFFTLVFIIHTVYTFITTYHLARFGVGALPKLFALIYVCVSCVLLLILFAAIMLFDITDVISSFK